MGFQFQSTAVTIATCQATNQYLAFCDSHRDDHVGSNTTTFHTFAVLEFITVSFTFIGSQNTFHCIHNVFNQSFTHSQHCAFFSLNGFDVNVLVNEFIELATNVGSTGLYVLPFTVPCVQYPFHKLKLPSAFCV